MSKPFFTVIVPFFNRTTYLRECLESILLQETGDLLELVITDDSSEDANWRQASVIIGEVSEKLGRVGKFKMSTIHPNGGWARNVNDICAGAAGQWISIINDDDYVLPGFYAKMREVLTANAAMMASVPYQVTQATGDYPVLGRLMGHSGYIGAEQRRRIMTDNPFQVCSVLISKKAFSLLEPFSETLDYCADWEFWVRASGFQWWYQDEPLVVYRQHEENLGWNMRNDGREIKGINDALRAFTKTVPQNILSEIRAMWGFAWLRQAWVGYGSPLAKLHLWYAAAVLGGSFEDPPVEVEVTTNVETPALTEH